MQLSAALKAVVQNALEAIGSGGHVEIGDPRGWSRLEAKKTVQIIVTDDGPGIDPIIAAKAFDPFFSGREAGAASASASPNAGAS